VEGPGDFQEPDHTGSKETCLTEGSRASRAVVHRFAAGAGGSLAAAVAGQSLPLLAAALLARTLPPPAFGAFIFLYGTAGAFASLTGYSFGLTATRYVAVTAAGDPSRTGRIVAQLLGSSARVSTLAVLIGLLVSTHIGPARLEDLGGMWSLLWTALLFFALAMAGVQSGVLGGYHRFSDVAVGNLVRMAVGLPLAIWAAGRFSSTGALAALALASTAGCCINHLQILTACKAHGVTLNWRSARTEKKLWIQFSVPSFLAYALVGPVLWTGQTFLLGLPNGLHEVAVFNIAAHWRNVIVFVPAAMVQAATPLLSELLGLEDSRGSTRVFYLNLLASGLVALCCALLIVSLGRLLLSVYGANYVASWPVLAVSAAAAVLAAINNALGAILVASGRMWAGFILNFLWAVAVLVLTIPMTERWGALGLSAAVLIAYVLHSAWQTTYILSAGLVPGHARTSVLADAV
jgi:O-antigen/teichoic acid export membrane protein